MSPVLQRFQYCVRICTAAMSCFVSDVQPSGATPAAADAALTLAKMVQARTASLKRADAAAAGDTCHDDAKQQGKRAAAVIDSEEEDTAGDSSDDDSNAQYSEHDESSDGDTTCHKRATKGKGTSRKRGCPPKQAPKGAKKACSVSPPRRASGRDRKRAQPVDV